MISPFDVLKAINKTKERLITKDNDREDYNAFLINRGLSYFTDTILFANEMNMNHHLAPHMQFDYLNNAIRKGTRFSEWFKKKDTDAIAAIQKKFGFNYEKAQTALKILTEEQLEQVMEEPS